MSKIMAPIPPALKQALQSEFVAGEQLLWSAQPSGIKLKGGFGIWLFAIPWTLFSLFLEVMTFLPWFASSKTPAGFQLTFGIVFPIFCLPFLLIGFWMLWQPIGAMRKARDTVYGLTNRRMIRIVIGKNKVASSVLLDQIGPIERKEERDGWGHLRIQTHSHIDSDGDRSTEKFEILGIPDVATLERLIIQNTRTGAG